MSFSKNDLNFFSELSLDIGFSGYVCNGVKRYLKLFLIIFTFLRGLPLPFFSPSAP
jgi:hypothetical protein